VAEWSAEIVVDAGLARRLIGAQFPELELGSLRLLGEGWDNTVWLVGERWVFRFPRREVAVPAVERQVALLPRLAPLLPLPIPEPLLAGRPADGYPWPFFGARLLPGHGAAEVELDDAARARLARPFAGFLRALHGAEPIEVVGASALPVDPMARADMARRVPRTIERLAELAELGLWRAPPGVDRLLDSALGLPPTESLAVTHGDLHLRHLLVDGEGVPSGVIDWDDLCLADPSIDLPLVWSLLPPEGRRDFLTEYGAVSDEQLHRARILALFLCATLAIYARREGMSSLERAGIAGLLRTTTD
jgi:aminoglycoside phosphotransferase (APT) family kinase protein